MQTWIKKLLLILCFCSICQAANNFSADPNCKALWRFEDGVLTADSKGGNTLTAGEATANTTLYKEGGASAEFNDRFDKFSIADADLDAGFPLKDGDSNKKFSIAFWARMTSLPNTGEARNCFMKYTAGEHCIIVKAHNFGGVTSFGFQISTDGISYDESYFHASAIAAEIWYHVSVTYQASDGAYRIRVWDDDAQAILGVDKTGTAGDIHVDSAPVYISGVADNSTMLGQFDEMVIFDDVLTADEIDQIRAGTYGGAPPAAGGQVIMIGEF